MERHSFNREDKINNSTKKCQRLHQSVTKLINADCCFFVVVNETLGGDI